MIQISHITRKILFFFSILGFIFVSLILNSLFSDQIYQLLFFGPLGNLNRYLFSGFYFYYFFVVYIIYGFLVDIFVAIFLATIFFPKSKRKFTLICFFSIFLFTIAINTFGVSKKIDETLTETKQKDSFKVISEEYTSKNISDRITPNIIFNVEITNTSKDILEGEINANAQNPHISLFYCKNNPEEIKLEPKATIALELNCTVPGNSSNEQTKELMRDIPNTLDFTIAIVPTGNMPTFFRFKTQPHNWAEY